MAAAEANFRSSEKHDDIPWGKSLENLPPFTRKELEAHRERSGKLSSKDPSKPVKKTLKRGAQFLDNKYLSCDETHCKVVGDKFMVKSKCRASMSSREIHSLHVVMEMKSGNVINAYCTCKAGKSGYCNHIMSLLLQLARFYLEGTEKIPEDLPCTSDIRKWGIPGVKDFPKEPIMNTSVKKSMTSRGINPTLYDPRINEQRQLNVERMEAMQSKLKSINPGIGFAQVISSDYQNLASVDTNWGSFLLGSPLSFHLTTVEFNFKVITNLTTENIDQTVDSDIDKVNLPYVFPDCPEIVNFSAPQIHFLQNLQVTCQESIDIERKTVKQRQCDEWLRMRENRLGSSVCHRVFVRKRCFKSLVRDLNKQHTTTIDDLPPVLQKKLKHGIKFEPVARDKYTNVMKHHLNRPITIRETGMVIPPSMYWLEASPDGVIIDPCSIDSPIGLVEIKCPEGKKNQTPAEAMADSSFYVEMVDGKPTLKKNHHLGYYTQIQLAMGFCGLSWCDFVVYLFKGLIISRVPFDEVYFNEVVCKINTFYAQWFLPELMSSP